MSSSTVVFVGPTMSRDEVLQLAPDAAVRGPAGRGDIYRAVRAGFSRLCILDGYFEHRLSVWHKEVLFALAEGARVYGAASMGALRAAEMDIFGMVGVGAIYEMFRSGELEDDDEVALVHLDADHGYFPCSEAMVNIRVTLRYAVAHGIIASHTARILGELAKQLFYPERTYDDVLNAGERAGLEHAELHALRAWLSETGGVDQKRLDARALLAQLAVEGPRPCPSQPSHAFSHTSAWETFLSEVHGQARTERARTERARTERAPTERAPTERARTEGAKTEHAQQQKRPVAGARLLQELQRRHPELVEPMLAESTRRTLALELARAMRVPAAVVQRVSEDFRRARGLLDPVDTEAWVKAHDLDAAGFTALMRDEALIGAAAELTSRRVLAELHSTLCAAGTYLGAFDAASLPVATDTPREVPGDPPA